MRIFTLANAFCIFALLTILSPVASAQTCSGLTINTVATESRCMSTGTITVNVSGGSGLYNYKVSGPVNTPYTSSSLISGLSAGNYTVTVKDITGGCTLDKFNVIITGSYSDPRFSLSETDETCMNSQNGTVSVINLTGGRGPFTYTIIAPSPMGVGISNTSGLFSGLTGGDYSIQLRDSCGGIQTRRITVLPYNWWIDTYSGIRNNCDYADFSIQLRDNKGNLNTSSALFGAFQYGVVRGIGDTVWNGNYNFTFHLQTRRSVTLVAKDGCGNVKSAAWAVTPKPAVGGTVSTSQTGCNAFSASITGQSALTNPQYCLYTAAGVLVSCNTTGNFTGFPKGSYYIDTRDDCYDTTIRRNFTVVQPIPNLSATVTTSRPDCSHFNATVTGMVNFTSPNYCLYTAANVLVSCNTTGSFTNIPNGSYSIQIQDGCYDTTIIRNVSVTALVPSVAAAVTISDRQCNDFDVSIGTQTNLSSPSFCLYDAANVLIGCNGSGTFNNLAYGNYCIKITNSPACFDTTITRCFTVTKLLPAVGATLNATRACNTVTISVTGQANLNNPQYCIYDVNNVQIACNGSGTFSGLPYGTYCVDTKNDPACYDTTIRRCITVAKNLPVLGAVTNSSMACTGFTATVGGQSNLSSPVFTIKNSVGSVVATNSTGVFNNLAYGSYCVEMLNSAACYDTLITRCFSATQPIPSAGAVTINGQTCTTFNADVTGESNLTTPIYYLVGSAGDTLSSNGTGTFNNINYGSYCIHIRDNCYDTSIVRCFNSSVAPITTTISTQASCTMYRTNISVQVNGGTAPFTAEIYDPMNNLVGTASSATNPVWVNNLPQLPAGQQYRVVGKDACNRSATQFITPVASTFNRNTVVTPKCPSGIYQNGSSDLAVTVSSTLGTIFPIITAKDGTVVSLNYSNQSGNTFTWVDLPPATYVVMYNLPAGCVNKLYDTLTVGQYTYPALDKSAAYQCDNNNFSVGASVTGGAAPFMYEVIGSVPAAPSIVTPQQGSPVFNVTNGTVYSLVRLRAIDNCGNATLNDVSILPLANIVVTASSNCYYQDINLQVDTIPNATYQWFKKTSPTDSVLVASSQNHTIPYLLPSDTGTYVSKISVNSGCLTKLAYFRINGWCGGLLPVKEVTLFGKLAGSASELTWVSKEEKAVKEYLLERSQTLNGKYKTVGFVDAKTPASVNDYLYLDHNPDNGTNYYRLKIVDINGKYSYSNIVTLTWLSQHKFLVYPNPAKDLVNVAVANRKAQDLRINVYSISGQLLIEKTVRGIQNTTVRISRDNLKAGMYLLKITDVNTSDSFTQKIIFE